MGDEGTYRLYDLQGDYQQFSLGPEAAEIGVLDARIYEYGLVAMTTNLSLLEVKGWNGSKPLTLANPGMKIDSRYETFPDAPCAGFHDPPPCWSLIEPDQTVSRHVEVLLPHEMTMYRVDSLESVDEVQSLCFLCPLFSLSP